MPSSIPDFKVKQGPIAVVGMSCRFPGNINSPTEYWDFICSKKDGISEIPGERWHLKKFFHPKKGIKGKSYTAKGGFLKDIDLFDADFFRISPREAAYMDPQQRILLELTWEAFEDGGIVPDSLSGSKTGVYVGLFVHDYTINHYKERDPTRFDIYSGTGISPGITASRISYYFDFRGPSLVIDTACSSSLVAAHYGCNDLLTHDADVAVVGGVNLTLIPEMYIVLCQANMLSPDGYCKAFDSGANGYARSEGAGIVILKRLDDAIRDQNQIYGIILGSAINQDGTSDGLTVPNEESQKSVIKNALLKSGINGSDVQYVEAHGTGTEIGDPIEANSLGNVLSQGRPKGNQLYVGSVKTNIGHTESAAGIAGLIKTALMLKYKKIPPNLHFDSPNPNIPFEKLQLKIPTSLKTWTLVESKSRIAGVNSFGFGGTNAHAILQEYLPSETDKKYHLSAKENQTYMIPFSAKSPLALRQYITSFILQLKNQYLRDSTIQLQDLAFSAAQHKSHHVNRLTVSATTKEELLKKLEHHQKSDDPAHFENNVALKLDNHKIAFVFSGMGQQWKGMGRYLYEHETVCKNVIHQCDEQFRQHTEKWSVIKELLNEKEPSRIDETQITQPCIFTLQVALYKLWKEYGILPDSIVGHSIGEIAAYHCAGALSLEDAVSVVFHRSRLQQKTAGLGTMLAVGLSEEQALEMLRQYDGKVEVGAINSLKSTVLSGEIDALKTMALDLDAQTVFNRFIRVEVPYHSSFMDEITEELAQVLKDIKPRNGHLNLISTVTGKSIKGEKIDADYWCQNVRQPVNFKNAMDSLIASKHNCFLEISAHPVLSPVIQESLATVKDKRLVLPSMKRSEKMAQTLIDSLGRLYSSGKTINWSYLLNKNRGKFIHLPPYPWQRKSFWNESAASKKYRTEYNRHPLLGKKVKSAMSVWNSKLNPQTYTYLKDHSIFNSIIYPAAAYIEMMIAASVLQQNQKTVIINNIEIKKPLLLHEDKLQLIQLIIDQNGKPAIFSELSDKENIWTQLISAQYGYSSDKTISLDTSLQQFQNSRTDVLKKELFYQKLIEKKFSYGKSFQNVESVWKKDGEILAKINGEINIDPKEGYHLHPAILDACFQPISLFSEVGTFLPTRIGSFFFTGKTQPIAWSFIKLSHLTRESLQCDVFILNQFEEIIAIAGDLVCSSSELSLSFEQSLFEDNLYSYRWFLTQSETDIDTSQQGCLNYSIDSINNTIKDEIEKLKKHLERIDYYDDVIPRFNHLCREYIIESLVNLGWRFDKSHHLNFKDLVERLCITPDQVQFFRRLLEIIGVQNGDVVDVESDFPSTNSNRTWNELLNEHPSMLSELLLVNRCGKNLHAILKGEKDALDTIFLRQSSAVDHLYQDSPSIYIYHELTKTILQKLLQQYSVVDHLNILELGAGTGGLTTHLFPVLPLENTTYCFSDVSKVFLQAAKDKFSDYDCIEYQLFDLEKDIQTQNFKPNSFDLILASDVLHVTSDLETSLDAIKTLLKPNGTVLFIELINPPLYIDLIFGALKGWWTFTDKHVRPHYSLLSYDKWLNLLTEKGFVNVFCYSDGCEESIHGIFIGKKSENELKTGNFKENQTSNNQIGKHHLEDSVTVWQDSSLVGNSLISLMEKRHLKPIVVNTGNTYQKKSDCQVFLRKNHIKDTQRFFDSEITAKKSSLTCIYLWNLDAIDLKNSSDTIGVVTNTHCIQILYIVKSMMSREWQSPPTLILITSGVHPQTMDSVPSMHDSPIWGLKRTVQNEYPNLTIRIIDIDSKFNGCEIERLCNEIMKPSGEDEIVLRGNKQYVNRLLRLKNDNFPKTDAVSYALINRGSKHKQSFVFQETKRTPPQKNEIEIKVKAVSMNFKDIATVIGLIPVEDKLDSHLLKTGYECSGIITRVGDDVDTYKTGDHVYGIGWGCYSRYVNLHVDHISLMPNFLSFYEASTIPIAYLTAYYALIKLARIQNNERVLIHTASGGVGLAAIQIARTFNAKIYTTAGSEEKRQFLEAMNVEYVGDSRSLMFADNILKSIKGEGIDIVINTLPGEAIEKSLSVLKPFTGRFIDISNFHNEIELNIKHLRKGISTFVFDLEMMSKLQPERIQIILNEINKKLQNSEYFPLPFRVFQNRSFPDAFKHLKKASHIGKVCIAMEDDISPIPGLKSIPLQPDKTYLIAGGYGGFGFATARHFISHGARNLLLIGRRGIPSPEIGREIDQYRQKGINIETIGIDICNAVQVNHIFENTKQNFPPIGGIVHAAMVMNINIIMNLDEKQFREVMNPKILGAWNLHEFSKDLSLEFFILYSSVTTVIGFPGQVAYSSANYFINQLAIYRRSQNLPATSICWGAIDEVGYLKRNIKSKEAVIREGFSPLSLENAWKTISFALRNNLSDFVFSPIKWSTSAKYMTAIAKSPRFSLIKYKDDYLTIEENKYLNQSDDLSFAKYDYQTIKKTLCSKISSSLGIALERINEKQTFEELNFDSLLAVELGVKIYELFGIDLPKMAILQPGLSINGLVDIINKEINRHDINKQTQLKAEEYIKVLPENINLLNEVVLPSDIHPIPYVQKKGFAPDKIFLTGATGFLGAYLLKDLLEETNAEIFCLVRADNTANGKKRIIQNLNKYNLKIQQHIDRIIPIVGDLAHKKLALTDEAWLTLCREIDVIFHNGAWLNFVQSYSVMKPVNVEGTLEIIRLASAIKSKPLHFVSSLAKLAQTVADPAKIADASTTINYKSAYDSEYIRRNSFNIGYHQSKWVADELVLEASFKGLPITIYRPSLIAGDSTSGNWNTEDYICQLIKGCISIGAAPYQDAIFDFCPVDYISKAMVYLASKPESYGTGFLLKNPKPISWIDFISWFSVNGYKIDIVSPEKWLKMLNSQIREDPDHPLFSLLPLFEIRPLDRLIVASPTSIKSLGLLEKNTTQKSLKKSGISCPPVDKKQLNTYLRFFRQTKFLQRSLNR